VGDVNLFYGEWLDPATFEINVMIADQASRGKGLAKLAVLMAMYFAARKGRTTCLAKIKKGNDPSLKLFKSLGF
jgi:L-amino acid N-acyltransferase YncA